MKINYFDFGLHKGDEIQMFLDATKSIQGIYDISVYGFEAHPELSIKVANRYSEYDNVEIINKAISFENSKIRLYIAEGNKMEGNSVFSSKNNVSTDNYVDVDGVLFSDWLIENETSFSDAINVIRFNIEGAEIYLLEDIISSGLNEYIYLYLGSSGGVDILKCEEIAHLHSDYEQKLKQNGIEVHQFCSASTNNISADRIVDLLTSKKIC
jgi:FkbM family methyltransferase